MNNKQLKNLLKSKADEITLENRSDKIIEKVTYNAKYNNAQKSSAIAIPRKRLNYYIITAIAVCLLIIAIPIGIIFGKSAPQNLNALAVGKSEQVFSREMLALGNIIASDTFKQGITSYSHNDKNNAEYEKIANDVNYYLTTGEALLSKNNINIIYQKNTDANYSDFEFVMRIKYLDKSLSAIDYVAYFNKAEKNSKTTMIGICVIEGKSYNLFGEQQRKGEEIESELIIYTNTSGKSYISIENETELNENEYEFEYVVDDIVVRGVSLEVKTEHGVNTTEIEITENDIETSYEFEYKADNIIECTYEPQHGKEKIIINVYIDRYEYQFMDGTIMNIYRIDESKNASQNQLLLTVRQNIY